MRPRAIIGAARAHLGRRGLRGGDDGQADDGPPEADELPEDTAEPQTGGTLRYGLEADISTLVPQDNVCPIACGMVLRAVYDPLAEIGEDGQVVPVLLSDIEHNEDHTEWTLTVVTGSPSTTAPL